MEDSKLDLSPGTLDVMVPQPFQVIGQGGEK